MVPSLLVLEMSTSIMEEDATIYQYPTGKMNPMNQIMLILTK